MISRSAWLLFVLALVAASKAQDLKRRPEASPATSTQPALLPPAVLSAPRPPNADAVYQQLRSIRPNGQSFHVHELKLERDAGVFTFHDGSFYLMPSVAGRVTGAVFIGTGNLALEPPSQAERTELKLVMKSEVLDQPFTSAVLAFTDDTAQELAKASDGPAVSTGAALSHHDEMHTLFRHDLLYNLEARLLEDLLTGKPGGFFVANLKGPLFSKRLIFIVDPDGAFGVAPEEVGLLTSGDGTYDVTLGFRSAAFRNVKPAASVTIASPETAPVTGFSITRQAIDTTIAHNGNFSATSVSRAVAARGDLRVLRLNLFKSLRVEGVYGPTGEALDFIQEDKLHDADFAVILPKPLAAGESIDITTRYTGKDVLLEMGGGNYYPVGAARESWYPNVRGALGNYADYHLTFRVPKGMQIVATGSRVSESKENNLAVTTWQTNVPIAVAGFSMGDFKSLITESSVEVLTYANNAPPDNFRQLAESGVGGALGTMDTTGMLKVAASEGDAAIKIYTDLFGPLPYDHVALTQQTPCNYGQSWPMLVYLPICYFWDSTIKHQLGVLDHDPTYWKVVTAHEVAHQWWGQTVGFSSYRDQWMSEGFAEFSASVFLMQTRPNMKEYNEFWEVERKRLLEKNAYGQRNVDVGPVTMGTRLNTSRSGSGVYQSLIYPKGAYILHMLEMMYFTPDQGGKPFRDAMHDFVATYRNRTATTEDFKTVMERHMPRQADVTRDHRLDWFFNEYVYGTEVPRYEVKAEFSKQGDATILKYKITQASVSPQFAMVVPVYLEFENKSVKRVANVIMHGSSTTEGTANLGNLGANPARLLLNYNHDVLSAN